MSLGTVSDVCVVLQVLTVLFQYVGAKPEDGLKPDNFCLVEKWRKIERPLGGGSKVLKVWQAWGEDKSEVRLVVKRGEALEAAGAMETPSREVRRRRSKMVKKLDTVHPKTLVDERAKCRDSIQKLMRIIIAQGNTISTQLAGLKEKEDAIDTFEQKMHHLRMKESGRDYLLSTYLDQLQDSDRGKDALQVSPRTSRRGGTKSRTKAHGSQGPVASGPGGVQPQEVKLWTEALDKLTRVNSDLTSKVTIIVESLRVTIFS